MLCTCQLFCIKTKSVLNYGIIYNLMFYTCAVHAIAAIFVFKHEARWGKAEFVHSFVNFIVLS